MPGALEGTEDQTAFNLCAFRVPGLGAETGGIASLAAHDALQWTICPDATSKLVGCCGFSYSALLPACAPRPKFLLRRILAIVPYIPFRNSSMWFRYPLPVCLGWHARRRTRHATRQRYSFARSVARGGDGTSWKTAKRNLPLGRSSHAVVRMWMTDPGTWTSPDEQREHCWGSRLIPNVRHDVASRPTLIQLGYSGEFGVRTHVSSR